MIPDDKKVVYVTREIERALGIAPCANYKIASNKTPYGQKIKEQYPDYIILIEPPLGKLLGTTELLGTPPVKALLEQDPSSSVLVFKNTMRVEAAVKAVGRVCLNPRSDLSERVENKLSQIRWLGPLATRYLPSHGVKVAKYITWKGTEPFIIQWAHGHTGDGTMLVKAPEDLKAVQDRFPERMARITAFVDGPSFTVNVVVTPKRILMGNVSYQITGLQPFTDNRFSTVGNDWGVAKAMLSAEDMRTIEAMVSDIGYKMQSEGWKGLFGIDMMRDESRRKLYLIEVNARQPASSTFESTLQEKARAKGRRGLTTFEAHLRALLDLPIDEDLLAIDDGAQIVQRVTTNVESVFDEVTGKLEKKGFNVVSYQNTAPNSDLLRIQSEAGIMSGHGSFNEKGKEIVDAIRESHIKLNI